MTTRTVRLDEETEETLEELRRVTGLSISGVLQEGIRALKRQTRSGAPRAYEIYERLDLGPGGYAIGPSTASREAVRTALRRKHGR